MGLMCDRRRKKSSGNAGPSSCGRLIKKCWYNGWMPCWARFVESELYRKLLRGVMTGLLNTLEKWNSPGVYDAVSTQTATKAVKRAARKRKTKESGLGLSALLLSDDRKERLTCA